MGDAAVDSSIPQHIHALCHKIGVRWAGTAAEHSAAQYVVSQFEMYRLQDCSLEEYSLRTSNCQSASLTVSDDRDWQIRVRPCLFCPSIDVNAAIIDVGFGMPHEINAVSDRLDGAVALLQSGYEPFSPPRHLVRRLEDLARCGAAAAITSNVHRGQRMAHVTASDWRDDPARVALPLVQASFEDTAELRRRCRGEVRVRLTVSAESSNAVSWNSAARLQGTDECTGCLVVGAHHDTTPDSPGANDNAAGVAVMLETARLLSSPAGTSRYCAPPDDSVCFVRR